MPPIRLASAKVVGNAAKRAREVMTLEDKEKVLDMLEQEQKKPAVGRQFRSMKAQFDRFIVMTKLLEKVLLHVWVSLPKQANQCVIKVWLECNIYILYNIMK